MAPLMIAIGKIFTQSEWDMFTFIDPTGLTIMLLVSSS